MACNTPECGCVDCQEIPAIPPCTSCECNPGYCNEGCEDFPQTQCFIYNGGELPCLDVHPGDSLNAIFSKIDEKYCNVSGQDGSDRFVKVSETDTTTGYLSDKINLTGGNVQIEIANPSGDEQLTFNYQESFKVKTDGTDNEDFLINKIILKDDPLGIVIPQTITNEGGKVGIGFTIDLDALCTALKVSACIPSPETCDIVLTGLSLTPNENGDLIVNVGFLHTPETPPLFEYTIDGADIFYSPLSRYTIHNLSAGAHVIGVRSICDNGHKSNIVTGVFTIPTVNVICPSISLTSSDNSVAVAWSTLFDYTYRAEISLTQTGAAIQSIISTTGNYIFTGLSSAIEYWVKVIPTYLGVTKDVCLSQSVFTTQQTCNATVTTPSITNANSDGTVTLTWGGSGASTYEYRVGTAGAYITTSANSVNLSGQSIGLHTFYIRSRCANGLYGTSAQVDFTIPTATCTATIDSVSITNPNENGTATASWTSTGALSFEYKIGLQGTWITTNASTVNLNNLTAGNYTLYVRSKCSNGLYGGSNQATFTIPTPTCNAVVSNLTVTNTTSSGAATISWTGSGATGGYEYKLGLGSWIATTQTSVNLTGIADGTAVQVRGKCTNGLYGNTVSGTITIPQVVCSAPGTPTLSDVATNTYTAEWTFTDTDPSIAINAGTDNLTYPHSAAVALGSDLVATYGAQGNNQFLVQRIQVVEAVKTQWFNTNFNNGTFPDSVYYAPLVKNGWTYYITRDTFIFDSTNYAVTLS